VRHLPDPSGQADRGDGKRGHGERDDPCARTGEQRGESGAAEHAHECRGGRHEARQAGEARDRHRRDDRDEAERACAEHLRAAVVQRRQRQRPGDCEWQQRSPAERLERIACIGPRALCRARAAVGEQQLRRQPQRRHGEGDRHGERTRARRGAPGPQGVEREQREDLRPRERRQRAERERAAGSAGEARGGGAEDERYEQRLGHPAGDLARPVRHVIAQQHDARHRERGAREPRRARSPGRQRQADLRGEHKRHSPTRPHEDEPEVRGRVAGKRQRRGEQDRQRLPGRPARRVELEVGQLAPPDEPRPGVVDGLVGEQQRQHGERQAGEGGAEKSADGHA